MWAYNGGRGAYLCCGCRTMVGEDVGTYATPDDARTVHRLSAVVGKPCGRVFCSARCAADGGLSANEYAPMFSADRVKMGNRANAVAIGIALGVKTLQHDGNRVSSCVPPCSCVPPWLVAAWEYRPPGWLAFCARLRDAVDVREAVDAAYRLGGYPAALPLLRGFEEAAR